MYFMIKSFQRNSNKYLPLSFLSQKRVPVRRRTGILLSAEGRARDSGGAPPHLSSGAGLRPPDPRAVLRPDCPPPRPSDGPLPSGTPAQRPFPRLRAGESAPPLEPLSRGEGRGQRRIGLKKLRTFTKGSQLGHDLAVFFGYDTDVPKGNGRNHKYLLLFSLSQK